MDDDVVRLLKAFNDLSESEKAAFLKAVEHFETHGRLSESVRKEIGVVMGPLSGTCPYCGK